MKGESYACKSSKLGKQSGVRIAKPLLKEIMTEIGDELEINVEDGKIVLKPLREEQKKYRISDLVARIPENYKPKEEEWSPPEGREEW